MIAAFLYRNPRLLVLILAVILASGLSSFLVLPRMEDPVLSRRVGIVSTVFPGAGARRVESLVTVPLEETLSGISKIHQVRSNSQNGISNIVIELEGEVVDVDAVWTLVRDRINDRKSSLPETCLPPELEVVPLKAFASIMAVQFRPETEFDFAVLRQAARSLRSQLIAIPGTEQVDVFGDPGEEYLIEIEPETLAATGLSTAAVAQQILASQVTRPAGRLFSDGASLGVDVQQDPEPLDRISGTLLSTRPGGAIVELSEIATISRRMTEPASDVAVIDGREAIVLGALVSNEQQVDQWADQVEDTLAGFRQQYADDVTVSVLFSQRTFIEARMQTLLRNLGLGAAGVMVVVLILMGWRSMMIVVAALPLCALMVLAALRGLSVPVHQMSVTGLIVALGLLIDNAIVIVEDVRSRMLEGTTPSAAIRQGVRHLAMPLFGSTLTTALAFLPIATLPGPPGEFVGTIAVSVILAISASFLLSMTVIPALLGLLRIRASQRGYILSGVTIPPLRKLYERSLAVFFRWPILGVLLSLILPVMGWRAFRDLSEQFFPASDRSQLQIEVERAAQDTLQSTRETVDRLREIVAQSADVDRQHWFIGRSAPTFYYNVVPRRRGTPFYAQALIDVRQGADVRALTETLQELVDSEVLEARVIVRQLEQGPPFDAPIEVRVTGPDLAVLRRLGDNLRVVLGDVGHVIHTRSDLNESVPRISYQVNDQTAREAGLSRSQIAGLLYAMLEGAPAGNIYDGEEELPVRVKLALDGELKRQQLGALPLPLSSAPSSGRPPPGVARGGNPVSPANPVTLDGLTTTELVSDVGSILRINGERTIEVKAYIEAGVLPSGVIEEFKRQLDESAFTLPGGYTLQFGGETEQRSQAVNELIANGVILFALMLLTLVASFRSFRCALIVVIVGGLSAGLGPLSLACFGYPFGFMAIVGTMGLVGIAINDSIVVLAAIRADAAAQDGQLTDLVGVVSGCTRHVIATTLTTIVGFLPLIVGGGRFWPPLAITIAGAVGGATLLALYFVPSLYLLMFRATPSGQRPATRGGTGSESAD